MEIAKIKVSKAKALEILDYYKAQEIDDPSHPFEFFQCSSAEGIQIHGYRTKNPDLFTITFTGTDNIASMDASIFFDMDKIEISRIDNTTNEDSIDGFEDCGIQIGSDEVGVGDFFGPMIVTAVYFKPADMKLVEELKVKDSKRLTDARMEQIGPILSRRIKHYTVMCSASKVSSYEEKGFSTHWVLAHLHNLTHQRLIEKYGLTDDAVVYIDQFEKEQIYRHYLGESIVSNPLIFKPKGENRWPSVAIASIISRYEFILCWKDMEQKLGMTIPKGAGANVDKAYAALLKTQDRQKVDKYVKTFFRNYKDKLD